MKGSVKVMLSYDYCHFEVALASDEHLSLEEVNELRKKAQRLADEAVRQYKKAKDMAYRRENVPYEQSRYLEEIERISETPEQDRSPEQQAKLKVHEDGGWEKQFDCSYDYDDDWGGEETPF